MKAGPINGLIVVERVQFHDRLCQRAKAVYLGLITEVDKNLGKIFDLLKETGQWDDTLIIFTSDHGEQLGDHYLWGKGGSDE